eukprot:CAMPEP_0170579622 /NCGR_PEP_ID=MMETSP0224-20130122/6078_1 /TAXON_ID=285029 /ORGANISM="Togula jolla, Strain CCCM 725" /LENGTH=524 /DNA_ID=CAMNT_0010902651 /DNA_START=9 /DNA_END=1583 /DNA_ORIENTATION=+
MAKAEGTEAAAPAALMAGDVESAASELQRHRSCPSRAGPGMQASSADLSEIVRQQGMEIAALLQRCRSLEDETTAQHRRITASEQKHREEAEALRKRIEEDMAKSEAGERRRLSAGTAAIESPGGHAGVEDVIEAQELCAQLRAEIASLKLAARGLLAPAATSPRRATARGAPDAATRSGLGRRGTVSLSSTASTPRSWPMGSGGRLGAGGEDSSLLQKQREHSPRVGTSGRASPGISSGTSGQLAASAAMPLTPLTPPPCRSQRGTAQRTSRGGAGLQRRPSPPASSSPPPMQSRSEAGRGRGHESFQFASRNGRSVSPPLTQRAAIALAEQQGRRRDGSSLGGGASASRSMGSNQAPLYSSSGNSGSRRQVSGSAGGNASTRLHSPSVSETPGSPGIGASPPRWRLSSLAAATQSAIGRPARGHCPASCSQNLSPNPNPNEPPLLSGGVESQGDFVLGSPVSLSDPSQQNVEAVKVEGQASRAQGSSVGQAHAAAPAIRTPGKSSAGASREQRLVRFSIEPT